VDVIEQARTAARNFAREQQSEYSRGQFAYAAAQRVAEKN